MNTDTKIARTKQEALHLLAAGYKTVSDCFVNKTVMAIDPAENGYRYIGEEETIWQKFEKDAS